MTRPRLALAALLAVGLVLPACSVPFVGGGGDSYEVTAYFPRAVSVFASSDVRVLGLPAGTVTDVAVDGDRVRVEMSIPGDIKVPADGFAQIVPQSLIGERYIQLSPAFKEGMEAAEDGHVIDQDHTIIPVEPDEALAAIKEFLDSLDPDGIGRLVTNLDEDLRGNGSALNSTLGSLSDLVSTFAEKDDALARIVDSFDQLTATLVTREQQLGEVLDAFASASQVLADERQSIEELVSGLATLSQEGLGLVGEHATELRADISTLTDAAAIIDANLASVDLLLESGGVLTAGLRDAYDPATNSLNLRNNFSPLVPELVDLLLGQLGLPSICLPIMAECGVAGDVASEATPARITDAGSSAPIASFLALLGAPDQAPPATRDGRGVVESGADLLGDAVGTLLGVGS
ncbi:MAG: MCE family protein [Acidimicrobiales bacterium]|nr:MCE family protein [Acidimicrobiales bacterium]